MTTIATEFVTDDRRGSHEASRWLTTAFRKPLHVAADMTAVVNPTKNPTPQIGAIRVVAR